MRVNNWDVAKCPYFRGILDEGFHCYETLSPLLKVSVEVSMKTIMVQSFLQSRLFMRFCFTCSLFVLFSLARTENKKCFAIVEKH